MYVCTHYQIMCKGKAMVILRITHARVQIEFVYYHSSNIVLSVELYEKKKRTRICAYVFKVVWDITITALPSRARKRRKDIDNSC